MSAARSSGSLLRALGAAVVGVALLAPTVQAFGDFPCAGTKMNPTMSCAAWSTYEMREGDIAPDAVCMPDPIDPTVSYCGYASAACTSDAQCDYGRCGTNGKCGGYLGDTCDGSNACQAFFFCGTDGMCGGTGADCNNSVPGSAGIPTPNLQCLSNSCDLTNSVCLAMAAGGMPEGSPCSQDVNCASKDCLSTNLCSRVLAVDPSQGSRKVKRYVLNGSGPNVNACPTGQTACAVGNSLSEGFECIDSQNNLEQCGGCVSDGEGEDCTAIHGVEAVECQQGRCIVLSCVPGLVVSPDSSACGL